MAGIGGKHGFGGGRDGDGRDEDPFEKLLEMTIAKDFVAARLSAGAYIVTADERAKLVGEGFDLASVFVAEAKSRGKFISSRALLRDVDVDLDLDKPKGSA